MDEFDRQRLLQGDRLTMYHFFVVHYVPIRDLIASKLPKGHDDEIVAIIMTGIFRQFFKILPQLIVDSSDSDLAFHLKHLANERCANYSDNLTWVNSARRLFRNKAQRRGPFSQVPTEKFRKGDVISIAHSSDVEVFGKKLEAELREHLYGKPKRKAEAEEQKIKRRGVEGA